MKGFSYTQAVVKVLMCAIDAGSKQKADAVGNTFMTI